MSAFTYSSTISSSEIEPDEGIHGDIDYDFFDPEHDFSPNGPNITKSTLKLTEEKTSYDFHGEYKSNINNESNKVETQELEHFCSKNKLVDILTDQSNTNEEQLIQISNSTTEIKHNIEIKKEMCRNELEKVQEIEKYKVREKKTMCLELNLQNIVENRDSKSYAEGKPLNKILQVDQKANTQPNEDKNTKCEVSNNEKYKELMNCIAFQTEEDSLEDRKLRASFNFDGSVSSDTTSEITDVTPRPSSSGCSSMTKCETDENANHEKKLKSQPSKTNKQSLPTPPSMKLLTDAIDSIDKNKRGSIQSSKFTISSRKNINRRNLTFTNDELKRIERDNEVLLRKIQSHRKPHLKLSSVSPNPPRLSSSAINRRRLQQKIEYDNMILMKKIVNAKGTTNTLPKHIKR